jgi:hypothetical protein
MVLEICFIPKDNWVNKNIFKNDSIPLIMADEMKRLCYVLPYHSDYSNISRSLRCYTEDGAGSMRGGKVIFSEKNADCADWLFVQLSTDNVDSFRTKIPRGRRILLLIETKDRVTYDLNYLEQFGTIISLYHLDGYSGKNIVTNPCWGWFVGTGFGMDNTGVPLFGKLSDVYGYPCSTKLKDISIVSSLVDAKGGHKKRINFLNALREHFKDKIDYYGRHFNPIKDKMDAVAPYKYTIVIENAVVLNYWTEKLVDAWIGWSLPVYCGDPGIMDKVPDRDGLVIIDIDDIPSSLKIIENLLDSDSYESRLGAIKKCRDWAISMSNPYERVCEIIESAGEDVISALKLDEYDLVLKPRIKQQENINFYIFKCIKLLIGENLASLLYDSYKKYKLLR